MQWYAQAYMLQLSEFDKYTSPRNPHPGENVFITPEISLLPLLSRPSTPRQPLFCFL